MILHNRHGSELPLTPHHHIKKNQLIISSCTDLNIAHSLSHSFQICSS